MKPGQVARMYVPKIENQHILGLITHTEKDCWLELTKHKKLNVDLLDPVVNLLKACGWSVVQVEIKESE